MSLKPILTFLRGEPESKQLAVSTPNGVTFKFEVSKAKDAKVRLPLAVPTYYPGRTPKSKDIETTAELNSYVLDMLLMVALRNKEFGSLFGELETEPRELEWNVEIRYELLAGKTCFTCIVADESGPAGKSMLIKSILSSPH